MVWQGPNAHRLDWRIEIKLAYLWHFNFLPFTTWCIFWWWCLKVQANKEKETMLCVKDLGVRWQEGLGPVPKLCHMYPNTLFPWCWKWIGGILICVVLHSLFFWGRIVTSGKLGWDHFFVIMMRSYNYFKTEHFCNSLSWSKSWVIKFIKEHFHISETQGQKKVNWLDINK